MSFYGVILLPLEFTTRDDSSFAKENLFMHVPTSEFKISNATFGDVKVVSQPHHQISISPVHDNEQHYS